jgi:hypothetical protein
MFGFWKKYVDKKVEKKLAELKAIEDEKQRQIEHEAKLVREQEERDRLEFEKQLKAKRLALKESKEPYIEIISEEFIEDKGLAIKMDWNLAMINYLKSNNFSGNSEEDIIYSYMRALAREDQEKEIVETYLNDVSDV